MLKTANFKHLVTFWSVNSTSYTFNSTYIWIISYQNITSSQTTFFLSNHRRVLLQPTNRKIHNWRQNTPQMFTSICWTTNIYWASLKIICKVCCYLIIDVLVVKLCSFTCYILLLDNIFIIFKNEVERPKKLIGRFYKKKN